MSWREKAACRGMSLDDFFPADGDYQTGRRAKKVCAGCPVREECLEEALSHTEQHGIWGGLNPAERQEIRRRRYRASA